MCSYRYDILINKEHLLPPDFLPAHLTPVEIPFAAPAGDPKRLMEQAAAWSVQKLFLRASACGLSLYGISGYRSYERQLEIYTSATDKSYIAPPGASEHQSGLALDVSCPAVALDLTEDFSLTSEGRWLKRYSHLYGFILRYPSGKQKITGYAWEPWHIRYVTKSLAHYLTLTGLTLEEYHAQAATAPSAVP